MLKKLFFSFFMILYSASACFALDFQTLSAGEKKELESLINRAADSREKREILLNLKNFKSAEEVKSLLSKSVEEKEVPQKYSLLQAGDENILKSNFSGDVENFNFKINAIYVGRKKSAKKNYAIPYFPASKYSGNYHEIGYPQIPVIRMLLKAPTNGKPEFKVAMSAERNLPQPIDIYSSQKSGYENENYANALAGVNDSWPQNDYTLEKAFSGKDCDYYSLTVFPAKYNPSSKALTIKTSVAILVKQPAPSRTTLLPEAGMPDYKKHDVLYFTTKKFKAQAEKLAAWKSRTGVPSKAYIWDEGETVAGDLAFSFFNKIMNRPPYDKMHPAHIVLIGDDDAVNTMESSYVCYEQFDHETGDGINGYSTFDRFKSDQVYAVDKNAYPTTMVSRISVSSEEELANVIEKIINYESGNIANDKFYSSAFCLGADGSYLGSYGESVKYACEKLKTAGLDALLKINPNLKDDGIPQLNLRDAETYKSYSVPPLNRWFKKFTDKNGNEFYSPDDGTTGYYLTGTYPSDMFYADDIVNRGNNFMFFRGHGDILSMCFSSGIDQNHVDNFFNNTDQPFILFAICCSAGTFQLTPLLNQTAIGECIGEHLLRIKSKGAVAFTGSNGASNTFVNNCFIKFIADNISEKKYATLGEVVKAAKVSLGNIYGYMPSSPFHLFYNKYNILGDSSLRLRYEKPVKIDFDVTEDEKNIIVKVRSEDGAAPKGVCVCVSDDSLPICEKAYVNGPSVTSIPDADTCYQIASTDASGMAIFSKPASKRQVYINAISQGHKHCEKTMTAGN